MENIIPQILDSILYIEILCATIGTVYLKKYNQIPYRWFISYLWLLPIIEYTGLQLSITGNDNRWLYNLIGIVEVNVLFYLFYNGIKNETKKVGVLILLGVSWLAFFYNGIFISTPPFREYLNYSFSISGMLIGITALIYITDLVKTDLILNPSRTLLFWISIGVIFYHLCNIPSTAIINIMPDSVGNINGLLLVQAIASYLMYGCFIFGFIWSKKKYNFL